MTETNTQSCSLETECRIAQFRSFGFSSFDIVSNFGLPWRDLTGVLCHCRHTSGLEPIELNRCKPGLGQGFRDSDLYVLWSDAPRTAVGCFLKATSSGRGFFIEDVHLAN